MLGVLEIIFNIVKQACLLAQMESLGMEMCICTDSGITSSWGYKRHAWLTILKLFLIHQAYHRKDRFVSFQD